MIRELIEQHELEPHPEGGFYRRVFEHPDARDGRRLASSILYLLPGGADSRWHRIDAVEMWHATSGSTIELATSADGQPVQRDLVGVGEGQALMSAVPAGAWQSARALGAWALVTITVVPAFTWEGFELAPEGWQPSEA